MMNRFSLIAALLVVCTPVLSLLPVGRIASDWVQLARVVEAPHPTQPARGFDWVVWEEQDGAITAAYVFPNGPAAASGLRTGDVFYMLEYQQYFNAEDLLRVIEGLPLGSARTYYVLRGGEHVEATVPIKPYPTFIYPLSNSLWTFSIWGFTVGAFLHVLALIIVGPLAPRSHKAAFSLLLILCSALWMVTNLLRLLAIEVLGPPGASGTYAHVFQGLTVVGLVGWIGFPALLFRKVLREAEVLGNPFFRYGHLLIYLPPVLLGLGAILTTAAPGLLPVPLDGLIAPILFYVCCYIGAAAAFVLACYLQRPQTAEEQFGGWSRAGSFFTFGIAAVAALSVLGILPAPGAVTDTTAGWLVVAVQLLTLAPVALVSLATLRHGKVNLILSRGLFYLTVLGLIFFAFVGGMTLLEPYLHRYAASRTVIAGLYVVVLLVVFERLARPLRTYAARFFATDRQRKQQSLSRFQERMRNILDLESLAHETIQTVSPTLDTRSAVIFLRPHREAREWISSTYHPEPPYFTERLLDRIWPHMQEQRRIWARNPELNECALPPPLDRLLRERRAALAVPILGDEAPIGLLVLGAKQQRRAVYNLEDLDLLRSLSGQLALAVERLHLVEREKALVRETAEAQLVALRAQINPHFLFNALNTIIALIEERPEEAEANVERLAAIFRHILQTGSQPFVPLEEELTLVNHYLHIEQARFGPKLQVTLDIPADLRTVPVPAFSVQTLVENAVKHGIEQQRQGGHLRITIQRRDDSIDIVVVDTGAGIPALFDPPEGAAPDTSFFGIGLQNVAARLKQLYDRDDLLRLRSAPNQGTTARLRVPLEPRAPHEPRNTRSTPAVEETNSSEESITA